MLQVSLQTAKSLKEDRAAEQCRDLRAVLNLLIHITQSDLFTEEEPPARSNIAMVAPPGTAAPADGAASAAAAEGGTGVIARVVLVGLNIVLPLINAGEHAPGCAEHGRVCTHTAMEALHMQHCCEMLLVGVLCRVVPELGSVAGSARSNCPTVLP
jgi:hypothetical protein